MDPETLKSMDDLEGLARALITSWKAAAENKMPTSSLSSLWQLYHDEIVLE